MKSIIALLLCCLVVSCFTICFAKKPATNEETLYVHLVPHSHLDPGWLYTIDEYFENAVKHILDTVVKNLLLEPKRKFIWVETVYFQKWWDQATDQQQRDFRFLLTQTKQIEFVLGGWVMEDEALTTYSADINQLTHGHQFLLQTFGAAYKPRIGWQIDPFGAMSTTAMFYKLSGFDYHVLARIDYSKKAELAAAKQLEFFWEFSPQHYPNQTILTHILDDSYCTPLPFDYEYGYPWTFDPKYTPLITPQNIQNRTEELVKLFRSKAAKYATNHLLFPYGCDFEYRNASVLFNNITLLMDNINRNASFNVVVKYSLLSEYFDTISALKSSIPTFSGVDFTPYADGPHSYWTGYYTSRPFIKQVARMGEQMMRTSELLYTLARATRNIDRRDYFDWMYSLRSANGDVAHHDAVTGTERPVVIDMYSNDINNALTNVNIVSANALALLMRTNPLDPFTIPSLQSSSSLMDLQSNDIRVVVLVNSLGWTRENELVLLQLNRGDVSILDANMNPISFIVEPVQNAYQVSVLVPSIPALGFTSLFVQVNAKKKQEVAKKRVMTATSISNQIYQIDFCDANQLCRITNKKSNTRVNIAQELMSYQSFWNATDSQASGAYIFRPLVQQASPLSSNAPITVTETQFYKQVEQQVTSYAKQRIRLYEGNSDFVEISYEIGPNIPGNQEIISRFTTDIKNQRQIYTDSNGLEMTKRTFNDTIKEPVAGNYYSTQYASYIKDSNRQLTVVSDMSRGVASIHEGELELMLHRRCLQDDNRGLEGYPLNDTTTVFSTTRLTIDTPNNSGDARKHAYFVNYPISIFTGKEKWNTTLAKQSFRTSFGALQKDLPFNIHLLNLDVYSSHSTSVVMRFVNIMEKVEGSSPQTITVDDLFSEMKIQYMQEMKLSVLEPISAGTSSLKPITVKPIELKTYLVELQNK